MTLYNNISIQDISRSYNPWSFQLLQEQCQQHLQAVREQSAKIKEAWGLGWKMLHVPCEQLKRPIG